MIALLFLVAIGIVVGGNVGISINSQKVENIDNNPIYAELLEKVKSGELKVNQELGLNLVQGMRDAHVDAGNYLVSIFNIFIYIGIFLLILVSTLALVTWRLYSKGVAYRT